MNLQDIAKEAIAGFALILMGAFLAGVALAPLAFVWWLIK